MARLGRVGRIFDAVIPSDTVALAKGSADSFYIGGAGDVVLKGEDGDAATFVGVPAGSILPCGGKIVMATGTTATDIVAIYEGP